MNNIGLTLTADARQMIKVLQDVDKATTASLGHSTASARQLEQAALDAGHALSGMASTGSMRQMAALSKQVDQLGLSSKQTAAALRGVPAQFTDIVVSLQGGQAPLTVLLQQGGQLKDMFGGIGPAARALGGYVMDLVNPLTLAAAAVGVLAVGYKLGSEEADKFRLALVSTGNAAGASVDQLAGMADAMDATFGVTTGKAAEALTALAQTGQVGRASLQDFAQVAIDMEKSFGQSIEKTAENFAALGKDPVGASKRLNESLNFLTAATYAQIKAAVDLGQTEKAAAIAQEAYASAMKGRAATIVENLGYIERAYRASINWAKEAWDSILGIGRAESTASQAQKIEAELSLVDKGLRNMSDRQVQALRAQLEGLRETEKLAKLSGDKQAERVAAEKAGIAAVDKAAEEAKKNREARDAAAKKAAEDAMRVIEDGVKLQQSLTAKDSGLSPEFAKQWDSLGKAYKANKISLDQLLESQRLLLDQQPFVKEQAKQIEEAAKREAEGLKITNQLREDSIKPFEQSLKTQQKRVESLEQEEAAIAIAEKMNVSLAQAVEMVNIARLEEMKTAARAAENFDAVEMIQKEIEEREKLVKLIGSKESREASAKAAKKAASEWQKASDKIQDSITDALMRGFEGGKGFVKNLVDTIKNMFNTMVLRPIVQAVVGGVTGLGGTSASAGDLASLLGGGGAGPLSMLKNAYSTITGGFAALGDKVAFAAQDIGAWLVNNTTGILNKAGSSLMQGSGMLGTAASYAAGGAVGVYGGRAISNGYSLSGSGNGLVNAGTAAGMFFGGPIGAAIGGAIAGGINRMFGRKLVDSGITGSFGGESGFEGKSYEFLKGGRFRSDKTKTGTMDESLRTALADKFLEIRSGVVLMAQSLGISADAVNKFTSDIKISFHGLTEEQIQEKLLEQFNKITEDMSKLVLGTSNYAKEGESAAQTLVRLSTSLASVNDVLDMLNGGLLSTSLAGADAASKLVDLFGGLQNFQQAAGAYYQAFYTEAERNAEVTQRLTKTLADQNIALPNNIEAYRALVNAQDLNTEAGRNTYAMLIALAPAFAQVANAAEQTAQRIASERANLQAQLDQLNGDTEAIRKRERESLDATNRELYDQIKAIEDARAAQEAYTQALSAAKTALSDALANVREAQNTVDGIRAQGTQNYLSALEAVNSIQEQIADQARQTAATYRDLAKSLREYVNGIVLPPSQSFGDALKKALAGDAGAMADLPRLADSASEAARNAASTGAEFRAEQARILAGVLEAADKASGLGVETPAQQAATLQQKLIEAQIKLADALAVANAIEAPLVNIQQSLVQQYSAAMTQLNAARSAANAAQKSLDLIVKNTGNTAASAAAGVNASSAQAAATGRVEQEIKNLGATISIGGLVKFDPNDPIRSVFDNISRSNTILTAQLVKWLEINSGSIVSVNDQLGTVAVSAIRGFETATNRAAGDANFPGLYVLQYDSTNYLEQIRDGMQLVSSNTGFTASALNNLAFGHWSMLVRGFGDGQSVPVSFRRDATSASFFATGGAFTNGIVSRPTAFSMGVMGEAGPEAIMPLTNVGGSLGVRAQMPGMDGLLQEMRAMREEINMLRAEARATAINTGRQADLMKRVTRNGEAMTVQTDLTPLEVTTA